MAEPQDTLPELARLGLEPNAYERLVLQRMAELEADLEAEDVRARKRRKAKLNRKDQSSDQEHPDHPQSRENRL